MPPRRNQIHVRAVRTPEAILALRLRLDSFPEEAREDGFDYFKDGAVRSVASAADHLVSATVAHDTPRTVTLFFTRGDWSTRCTCRAHKDCKHAYAAGQAWIAAVEAGQPDGRDPAEIVPTTESKLAAKLQPAGDRALDAELGRWLRALPESTQPALSAGEALFAEVHDLRVRLDPLGNWMFEAQAAAGKPWKTPTKKWLTQLSQLRPADLEFLPPPRAALATALGAEFRLSPLGLNPRQPLPLDAVGGLLRSQAVRPALALADGSPLIIQPEALVPEATVSADVADRFDLHLVTPDGEPADTARLVAEQPEPLYQFHGELWRGPPPPPSERLPVAALSDARLLPRLRAMGLRLPEGHSAELRTITLKPHLRCWLSPSIDGQERDFHAQLTARSENPPCEQVWTDDVVGWTWNKKALPPPRVAGAPALEFDLSQAEEASARFRGFRLGWDGWAESWMRPVNDFFAEEFVEWHSNQSPQLEIEVSPELSSLLGAPLQAHVATSIAPGTKSEQDWFGLTVALKVEDTKLNAEEVAMLIKAKGKWVHLPRQGGWRRISQDVDVAPETAAALDKLGLGYEDVLTGGRSLKHEVHVLQMALQAESLADRDSVFVHLLQDRAAELRALPPPPVPTGLQATLRPYQIEGFHFLAHLSAQRLGGVLADDMGLGKTVQTLAWLLHLSAQKSTKKKSPFRALIICPKSVMHGWLVETTRFAPDFGIGAFDPLSRAAAVAETGPRLLVANYTQLRLHAETFRSVDWDAVVLDEGQFIKNPRSQVAVAARSLRARRRVILTGTPIENRLSDLWSLFAFAQPGLLGDQAGFRRQYNEVDPASLDRLHRRVQHFLLRRTKAQAAPDLPPRTEDEIVVELEGDQRRLYDAELKRARAELLGIETAAELGKARFNVLASLLRLRQICCHPALVDPTHAKMPSAKLEALIERVEELAEEGHQVLVFSQFVEMLQIIRHRLEGEGIGHLMLTGATENRGELVERFQSDPSKTVFLLSLKAAGFGLNLTAASYAILYDPWWNPAAEAQAIDRIHRIGQTKPVIAYRLISDGTVEQKIRALQHDKAALAAAVVQEDSLAKVMDLDSLRDVLS
ncbi:DEAD/DEAH box helicase [Synoicihabitans lomoniglobus]|uniref:DEAD/DEAH box helicase n=1 Tax=Synoicihabitans lomoniglobus TaxID=2909285 RepID=A0AAE9ZUP4_9BACT|nr:DEAD/DEAH box helicase [Opitutaceae bacterium LMO-M01]WED64437.1 DEAD/DEAH box helicase [Opitutaceae bacterium LMO-M01]